jgi:hypothetical protein
VYEFTFLFPTYTLKDIFDITRKKIIPAKIITRKERYLHICAEKAKKVLCFWNGGSRSYDVLQWIGAFDH